MLISHIAAIDDRIDQPVVSAFHALLHLAIEIGQGLTQHRSPCGGALQGGHASEAIGSRREALEEMAQQGLVVFFGQHVQHEAITHLHQGFDGAVFGHSNREPRGFKAGLAHPAGHHGTSAQFAAFALLGGHHIEPATEAAQGFIEIAIERLHRLDGFGPLHQLAEVGAGFFAELIGRGIGNAADAQGRKALGVAQLAQLVGHRINGLVIAAVGVVEANGLFGFQGRQQGAPVGLQVTVAISRWGGQHQGGGFTDQGGQLLGIGAA